jgi:hypothetical protein
MSGTSFRSPDELISAISELIASLPKERLVSVCQNGTKHLNWVIQHPGRMIASESYYTLLTTILTEIAPYYKLSDRFIYVLSFGTSTGLWISLAD